MKTLILICSLLAASIVWADTTIPFVVPAGENDTCAVYIPFGDGGTKIPFIIPNPNPGHECPELED